MLKHSALVKLPNKCLFLNFRKTLFQIVHINTYFQFLYVAMCCTFTLQGLLWPVSDVSVKYHRLYIGARRANFSAVVETAGHKN